MAGLIEQLQKLPQNLLVEAEGCDCVNGSGPQESINGGNYILVYPTTLIGRNHPTHNLLWYICGVGRYVKQALHPEERYYARYV